MVQKNIVTSKDDMFKRVIFKPWIRNNGLGEGRSERALRQKKQMCGRV
jgi:hypothetical protein